MQGSVDFSRENESPEQSHHGRQVSAPARLNAKIADTENHRGLFDSVDLKIGLPTNRATLKIPGDIPKHRNAASGQKQPKQHRQHGFQYRSAGRSRLTSMRNCDRDSVDFQDFASRQRPDSFSRSTGTPCTQQYACAMAGGFCGYEVRISLVSFVLCDRSQLLSSGHMHKHQRWQPYLWTD